MAILCVAMFSSTAHSWGWATHAYIDDALNKADDERNMNEIYGGIAPDMFNYYFAETDEVRDEIFNQFHYDFMNIWNRKKTGQEKALAYGFVSHNELWGADMTAHKSGITFGESEDGEPEGYVVTWAKILAQNAPLEVYLPGIPEDLAMQLYHTFVEYGNCEARGAGAGALHTSRTMLKYVARFTLIRILAMPKLKTHKGLAKRIKITASGKIKHKRMGASHLMSGTPGKQCRNNR